MPFFILTDNASIHKTKIVKERLAELGIPLVLNVAYCPDLNGIESFWAASKRIYRAIGTQVLLRGRKRDLEAEAREANARVSDLVAVKCARDGLRAIDAIQDPNELD